MNKRVTLALLLSFCVLTPVVGQTGPTADKDDVVRITTNLVQVDAVVTKDGKPVSNLTAGDFEIYEDGKRQTITSFAYISNVRDPNLSTRNLSSQTDNGVEAPPAPLNRDAPGRTIAVVVDDLGLSAESMNQVRKRLQKFIAEEVQPNDLVAIIRTGGEMGALQQFTTNKQVLTRAVNQLHWNVCSRVGQTTLLRAEALGGNSCYQRSVEITLRALRFILNSMGQLPGRKSMIVMTDGIPTKEEEGASPGAQVVAVGGWIIDYGGPLQRLAEAAIRSSVVIYSVDTQGLQYTRITAADAVSGTVPERRPISNSMVFSGFRALQQNREAMDRLAKQTGGFQIHNSNDFQLDRILDDQRGYYLIGYRPTQETFNRRFHQIKAKVKRPGMTLRTRFGFLGVTEEEANHSRLTPRDQTNLALLSPFAPQDLEVGVNSFFTNGKAEGSIVRSFVYLNPANFSFVSANGRHETALEIHGAIFGDNGAVLDKVKHDVVLSLGDSEYQQAMRDGLSDAVRLRFDMPVKKPGSYQVRIAVRDRTSKKLGAAGQFVDVPDLDKKSVALSGIVLRDNGAAATEATVMTNPPGRRFRVDSDLHFAFFVYNASPNLVMQTKIFRDGKIVKSLPGTAVDENKTEVGPVLTTSLVRLTPDLEPGNYYLQVVIYDKTNSKQPPATQWVDFEIVK